MNICVECAHGILAGRKWTRRTLQRNHSVSVSFRKVEEAPASNGMKLDLGRGWKLGNRLQELTVRVQHVNAGGNTHACLPRKYIGIVLDQLSMASRTLRIRLSQAGTQAADGAVGPTGSGVRCGDEYYATHQRLRLEKELIRNCCLTVSLV